MLPRVPGDPASPGDQASPGDRASAVGAGHRAGKAEAALARVRALFAEHPGSARTARAHGRDATLALRDLYFAKDALRGADRAAAEAFLARPTDHTPGNNTDIDYGGVPEAPSVCGTNVCIHYIAPGVSADSVANVDTAPANDIPDYVDFALATMEQVHTTYFEAGYKEPKSDLGSTSNGGSGLTDVYLAQIADDHLYGYCASDDPERTTSYDISAYCVRQRLRGVPGAHAGGELPGDRGP
jgi:hypothetical protein